MRNFSTDEKKAMMTRALDWQRNDVISARRSARLAWTVAGVAGFMAAGGILAVAMLTPLKRVVPYVIQVDRTTGQTAIVTGLTGSNPMTYDVSVKRYFIAQYIKNREGWVPLAENEMIHAVDLMSADEERARFDNYFSPTNPSSPVVVFKDTPMATVVIRSINFLNNDVAEVHYARTVYGHSAEALVSRYVAVLTFTITNRPAMERDLTLNPIGFSVTNYSSTPEV